MVKGRPLCPGAVQGECLPKRAQDFFAAFGDDGFGTVGTASANTEAMPCPMPAAPRATMAPLSARSMTTLLREPHHILCSAILRFDFRRFLLFGYRRFNVSKTVAP